MTLYPLVGADGKSSTKQVRKSFGVTRRERVHNAVETDGEVLYLDVFGGAWSVVTGFNEIFGVCGKKLVESTYVMNPFLVLEFDPELSRLLLCQSCGWCVYGILV